MAACCQVWAIVPMSNGGRASGAGCAASEFVGFEMMRIENCFDQVLEPTPHFHLPQVGLTVDLLASKLFQQNAISTIDKLLQRSNA